MPIKAYSETQRLLYDHLNSLKEKLSELDGDREALLKEIEQAEKAFSSITTRRLKHVYNENSNFRQKIIFCLISKNKILSVNDMVSILTNLDEKLNRDKMNTAKSLRMRIRIMLEENIIIAIKPDNMKNTHYAMKHWVDENGEIKNDYLL